MFGSWRIRAGKEPPAPAQAVWVPVSSHFVLRVQPKLGLAWRTLEAALRAVTGKLAPWHHLQTVLYPGWWKPGAVLMVTGEVIGLDVCGHTKEFLLLSVPDGMAGQENYG